MDYTVSTFTHKNGTEYFKTSVSAMPFIRTSKNRTQEQFLSAANEYYSKPETHRLAYSKMVQNRWSALNQRCVNGKWSQTHTNQFKSYQRHQIELQMTKEEFTAWMESQKTRYFEILATGDVPSIDRIDNSAHYTISNIQLISRHENLEKRWGKECRIMTPEQKIRASVNNAKNYKRAKKGE